MNAPPPVVPAAGGPAFIFTPTHVGHSAREDLQHISTLPEFQHLSTEEIRLRHPQGLTRPMATASSSPSAASFFSSPPTLTSRLADLVYNNTPPRSHLRMLWRDIYTCVGNPTWVDVKEPEEALHVEFMMDIATKSMTFWRANFRDEPVSRKAAFFLGEDTCAYHEHVVGVCYATMGY
ncbi:hypothetical protein Tdes44962_MAKER00636 [Teratosphaeria destructans]|uniref:Uncharacterized protein n=1 Tax=Teratosphaeria destructans TaxID=418781 RepID=A0A9W7SN84_9PEZI|nr:hypothetical protein Tdes44962_MAKER00636 [Teratosphaeria destructans]